MADPGEGEGAGGLAGRTVFLTGAAAPMAEGVGEAMTAAGALVVAVDDSARRLATRDGAASAFAEAASSRGGPNVLVHAWAAPEAARKLALVDTDERSWAAACEDTFVAALWCMQAAFASMRDGGGRIILITPTISQSGAEGFCAYGAALEGQRALAKGAARQWGRHGITVNCIAPAPPIDAGVVSLAPPALGRAADPGADLGPVAVFLAGDGGHFVTGMTVVVDGGVWMSP